MHSLTPVHYHLSADDDNTFPAAADITWIFPSGWRTKVDSNKLGFLLDSVATPTNATIKCVVSRGSAGNDTSLYSVRFTECSGNCNSNIAYYSRQHTNLGEEGNDELIQLYPNPVTTHIVNLYAQFGEFSNGKLVVYSTDGRQVMERSINAETTQINTEMLSPGVYIFRYVNTVAAKTFSIVIQ